jgi:UDP-N-acetylglucosamine 3-dehydrogenase
VIKVGVIGLGAMGSHHARIYSQANCELVGVADADPVRAQEIGQKYNVPYYSDYHDLLPKVQAVSIAVPTTLHHVVAVDFLNAGIHCLVEKPIAFSLAEADEMVEAAENNHVNLAIGHIEQFNPAVAKLKQIMDQGVLGRVFTIFTRRVGPSAVRIRDVDIVVDSATHDIGVVKYLLGKEPFSIYSRVGQMKHAKVDQAIIVMDFAGTTACLETNWLSPKKIRTLVATGSEGIATLDYIEQTLHILNSHETEVSDVVKAEPLKLEIQDFLSGILEKRPPTVSGSAGRSILKIALESNHNNYFSSPLNEIKQFSFSNSQFSGKPKVVAAIPCYNTQSAIADVASRARKYVNEVIVVDDGSMDQTAMAAESSGALVFRHEKNKGYGEALKSCFKAALSNNSEIIVTIDGDGQLNPDEIPQVLDPILKGEADVVIGSRFLRPSKDMPGYRKFGISVINHLWNFGNKTKLSDSQSGFRAYRRNVMQRLELKEEGMGISIEIIEKIRKMGVSVKEVPITCSYENNNHSFSSKALFHGLGIAVSVLKIRLFDKSSNNSIGKNST